MGWVAYVILVLAQGPNPSFSFFGGLLFDLGACWDKGLDLDLDQGLTIYAKIKHVYKNSTHWQHGLCLNRKGEPVYIFLNILGDGWGLFFQFDQIQDIMFYFELFLSFPFI